MFFFLDSCNFPRSRSPTRSMNLRSASVFVLTSLKDRDTQFLFSSKSSTTQVPHVLCLPFVRIGISGHCLPFLPSQATGLHWAKYFRYRTPIQHRPFFFWFILLQNPIPTPPPPKKRFHRCSNISCSHTGGKFWNCPQEGGISLTHIHRSLHHPFKNKKGNKHPVGRYKMPLPLLPDFSGIPSRRLSTPLFTVRTTVPFRLFQVFLCVFTCFVLYWRILAKLVLFCKTYD